MLSEQERDEALGQLAAFAARAAMIDLFSTSARVVTLADPLYNVSGSSDDPQIDGKSWKELLKHYGISGDCFADTPVPPEGKTHPLFQVGGHMTLHADGSVPFGGTSYLMPLCKWHNSTSRNGIPFSHAQTRLVELSGYMEGEPAATFLARMSASTPLALVYLGDNGLTYRNVDGHDAHAAGEPFVLLRRQDGSGGATYRIAEASI